MKLSRYLSLLLLHYSTLLTDLNNAVNQILLPAKPNASLQVQFEAFHLVVDVDDVAQSNFVVFLEYCLVQPATHPKFFATFLFFLAVQHIGLAKQEALTVQDLQTF